MFPIFIFRRPAACTGLEILARWLLLTAVCLPLLLAEANGTETWHLQNRRPGGATLWGIISGPAGMIAVGTGGRILHSPDGNTWTPRVSPTNAWLLAVTYAANRYIAVGDAGTILTSVDGVTWSVVPGVPTTARLNNVAAGGLKSPILAVGEAGTILASSDGLAWTPVVSGTTRWLRGLTTSFFYDWVITGEAGTIVTLSFSSSAAYPYQGVSLISGTGNDIEAIAASRFFRFGRPVGELYQEEMLFLGAEGVVGKVQSSGTLVGSGSSNSGLIPAGLLAGTAHLRCFVTGPSQYWYEVNASGRQDTDVRRAPLVAIDDLGNAWTAGKPEDPWVAQALEPKVNLLGGMYAGTQNSFYVVGADESIFQLSDVFSARLGAVSTRGKVGSQEQSLIAGFIVSGPKAKATVVRAIGPELARQGVPGAVAAPRVTVRNSSGLVMGTNLGWETDPNAAGLAAATTRVGLGALAPGSFDSAMLMTLPPGAYTAQVDHVGGADGVGLVEVYDADAVESGLSKTIAISTRGQVGTDADQLIAGVVIQGPVGRNLLVRGVGPGLAKHGVAAFLADPVITVYDSTGRVVSSADDWSDDDSNVRDATARTGIAPLEPGSRDAAITVRLGPGNYTVLLNGKNGGTGVGLVEVYEIPNP